MHTYVYIHIHTHSYAYIWIFFFFFFSLDLVTPLVSYGARCLSCDCVRHCMCGHWELAFLDVMPIAACGPLVLGLVWWSCRQMGWQHLLQSAYCALMLHLTEYHDLFTCSLLAGGKLCWQAWLPPKVFGAMLVEQTSTCSSLPASFFLGPRLEENSLIGGAAAAVCISVRRMFLSVHTLLWLVDVIALQQKMCWD